MPLTLACAALNAAIPAILIGDLLCLNGRELSLCATPTIRRRLATAIRDGALVFPPGGGPSWEEIEASVEAEWAEFKAFLDVKQMEMEERRRARGAA